MEDQFNDQSSAMPDLQQLMGIVRRRRWHFLAIFFGCWLVVWGASWRIPLTYRSGTLILVEEPVVPEKYVVSNIDVDIQQQLDSITQQILSRTRLLHIIDNLHLYEAERKSKNLDDLVEQMRKDIDIELVRGDDRKLSAFNIYYTSWDPVLAQSVTRELANLFIAENLQQRQERSENTTKFLEEQVDQAREKLAAQEARVRAFKDQHIGELPTQTQSNLQILGGLQSQLQAEEDSLNRAKQQNTYLESLLNQYRSLEHGKSGETGATSLAAIDQELGRLKAQLADLSAHYTDKHPDVRKTKEQIAKTEKMRERLINDMSMPNDSAKGSDAQAITAVDTAPMLDLESQLKANQIEISNRQALIKDLQSKISDYQGRLNQAPVVEQQFADITRDYEQSKTDYDSLLAKKNQSAMATDLEKTQQGEHFSMLDPPNLPTRPYRPYRLIMCGAGIIAGLVLGGGIAAGPEFLAGKLHSEKEIRKIVPFDVLGEIPNLETLAERASEKRQQILAGCAAIVILFCVLAGSAFTYLHG